MSKPIYAIEPNAPDRGLQASLWRGAEFVSVKQSPLGGVLIADDFTERTNSGNGTGTAVTARSWSVDRDGDDADGTVSVTSQNEPDGVVALASTTTSGDDGATMQYVPAMFTTPKRSTAAQIRGVLVFDTRIDFDDADAVFVGLSEAGDQFLDTDSLIPGTSDSIGFYTDDGGTSLTFYATNDNDGGTQSQETFTIPSGYVESGYNRLGFRINKDSSLEIAVNDNWIGQGIHGISEDSLPIELLTPRFSVAIESGSTAPSSDIDYVFAYLGGVLQDADE